MFFVVFKSPPTQYNARLFQTRPGGEMVYARDFPPAADLPKAEKYTAVKMKSLEHRPAAYALRNSTEDWVYKGSTRDLTERIAAHFSGKVTRTKNRLPLKLVYCEYFDNYTDARRREIWLKTGQGRGWLKKQIG